MIPCLRSFAVFASLYLSGTYAVEGLPPESEVLMQKLDQFTEEQSGDSRIRIQEKRRAVATVLSQLLVTETKKGNLDEANAINDCKLKLENSEESPADILKAHPALPGSSRNFLEKLAQFQTNEEASLNQLIQEKNEAVAKILSTQLKSVTQKGDLEGANAIKATIKKLRGGEETPAPPKIAESATSTGIPKDALRHKGNHYKIFKTEAPTNWETARAKCREMGGDLGWTPDEEDIKMLKSLLQPFVDANGHSCIWIGGIRNEAGKWEWLDGSEVDESVWSENEDSRFNPDHTVMIRWIASFRGAQATSTRPIGYLCRWE